MHTYIHTYIHTDIRVYVYIDVYMAHMKLWGSVSAMAQLP